jgi:hypothetical protein
LLVLVHEFTHALQDAPFGPATILGKDAYMFYVEPTACAMPDILIPRAERGFGTYYADSAFASPDYGVALAAGNYRELESRLGECFEKEMPFLSLYRVDHNIFKNMNSKLSQLAQQNSVVIGADGLREVIRESTSLQTLDGLPIRQWLAVEGMLTKDEVSSSLGTLPFLRLNNERNIWVWTYGLPSIDSAQSKATWYDAVTRILIGETHLDGKLSDQWSLSAPPVFERPNTVFRVDVHIVVGNVVYDRPFLLPPHQTMNFSAWKWSIDGNLENAIVLATPDGWLQSVNSTATIDGQPWPVVNGVLRFSSKSPTVNIELRDGRRIENFLTSGTLMVLGDFNSTALQLMHDTDQIRPLPQPVQTVTNPPQVPPRMCVIANAAYGSELAAPVQFLRDFRDHEVESTMLGSAFMKAFNNWYYSWAPAVARIEAVSPAMRAAVRGIILPLLGALFLSHEIFAFLRPLNLELAILISGLVASSLIGLFYLAPLTVPLSYLTRRWRRRKLLAFSALVGAALVLMATLPNGTFGFVEVSLSLLVVETALLAPAAAARKLVEQMTD